MFVISGLFCRGQELNSVQKSQNQHDSRVEFNTDGDKAGSAPASSGDDEVAQVHFQSVLTGSKHNGLEIPKSSYRFVENTKKKTSEWLKQ